VVVAAAFTALTAAMTWPQARYLRGVSDLGDPLFAIWRFAWIAHQLPRNPLHLFDGNFFYPERLTYAYSDSVILPSLACAPLIWAGVDPVAAYNLVFLSAFVFSGVAMFALVWSVTGRAPAALAAGAAFAFFPFRFAHLSQIEMQMAMWMPVAAWALRRAIARGRLRDGLATGAAIGAQVLSCLHFGVFLVTFLVPFGLVLAGLWRRLRASVLPLAAGAALAAALVVPLAVPYMQQRAQHGERAAELVSDFSGRPRDYLVAPERNLLYGPLAEDRRSERELFPGIALVALAVIGAWPPLSVTRLACAAGLALAFDGSLGFHGFTYRWLYDHLFVYRGMRVPGRFVMVVGFALSWLAGYGVARLAGRLKTSRAQWLLAAACTAVILIESKPVMDLTPVPRIPRVYDQLARLPAGVVAELPMPVDEAHSPSETRYVYFSISHWKPIVNGYSGYFPGTYGNLLAAMREFPSDWAVGALRRRDVAYLMLHEDLYGSELFDRVTDQMAARGDMIEIAHSGARGYEVRLYRLITR
jgi:hypothetical protein